MLLQGFGRVWLLAALLSPLASADPIGSGWSVGLSCPPKGPDGGGALLASNAGGFGAAGSCTRVKGLFSKLTFLTHGGATLRSTTAFALQTASVLVTPPLLTTEYQPIFSVAAACPVTASTLNLNWIFVQWTETERRALTNTYLFGTAAYSKATGVRITGQYDVDGSPYFVGQHPMPGSCSNGVYPVSGTVYDDINGSIYFNAAGMGAFKTSGGRATFFFPRVTIVAATDFGSRTFRGLAFDSDSGNGIGDVRHVKGTADAAGTTFTVQALSDPENDVVDSSGSAYTDTVVFQGGDINSPAPGMLFGTVTRTGSGAGTGDVACIANTTDGDRMLLCSGQSPSNNLLPFHFSLYAENQHNKARGPNAGLEALAVDSVSGKTYVGGNFTTFHGTSRGRLVRVNADGTLDSTYLSGLTGFSYDIDALALDASSGKLYVGGDFSAFSGTSRVRVARLNTDGTLDTAFNPGTGFDLQVETLVLDTTSGKPYVGGNFTLFNGTGRNRIARLNTNGTLDTAFDPGTGLDVMPYSLAFEPSSGKLYVGGDFTTVNGTGRNRIARLDADGSLDTAFDPGTGFNGVVRAIALDTATGKLYVAGDFTQFNGTGRNRIARLENNGSLDTTFDPGTGFNAIVYGIALETASGKLYAGGNFTTFNGTSRPRIARIDTDGTLDAGFAPANGFNASVMTVAFDATAGVLLAGGDFSQFDGIGRNRLAQLNTGGTLDTGFEVGAGFAHDVEAVASGSSGTTYVGGHFTSYNGLTANHIVRLNSDGTQDTTFVPPGTGFDNDVEALASVGSGDIYAAGVFTTFNGTSRNRIARLNSDGTLDTDFAPGTGFNGNVKSLALDTASGDLYAGGAFATFNGTSRNRVARLDADGSLDTAFAPGTGFGGDVWSIALDESSGMLYAAGDFTTFNGTGRNRIARLDASGTLDTTYDPGTGADGIVRSISFDPSTGKLYAAGEFTTFNGTGRNRVARINADGSLDTTFNPGSGCNNTVNWITFDPASGKLYVVGSFITYNGTPTIRIARINPDGSLDTTFSAGSGFNGAVFTLLVDALSGKITAGGSFQNYGSSTVANFVRITYSGALD